MTKIKQNRSKDYPVQQHWLKSEEVSQSPGEEMHFKKNISGNKMCEKKLNVIYNK
jgi:hypothetical protein